MYIRYIGWAIREPGFHKWLNYHLDKPIIGHVGFIEPVILKYIKTHKLINKIILDNDYINSSNDVVFNRPVKINFYKDLCYKTVLSVNNGFILHICNFKRKDDDGWWCRCK